MLGLADQPAHGLPEVADFFFLAALALAAHDPGTVVDQAAVQKSSASVA
jgi:hypothetical protein